MELIPSAYFLENTKSLPSSTIDRSSSFKDDNCSRLPTAHPRPCTFDIAICASVRVHSINMTEPISPCSQPPNTPQQCGIQHTGLPTEIWAIIFSHVSMLPDQSLAPLAAVCRGWQREVEPLTFSDLVVRPIDGDIAMLRRVLQDGRRSGILSKINFFGPSSQTVFQQIEESGNPNFISSKICEFFRCLNSTVRDHPYPPLTLTFYGWDDLRAPVNTLRDSALVAQNLEACRPSHCPVKHIVLALERQLWPSTMFADMVRFCSPELKKIDLGLIAEDNEEAEYNTCELRIIFCSIPHG